MSQRSKILLLLPRFKQMCFLVSHRLPPFSAHLLLLWSRNDVVGGPGMTLYSSENAWRESTDSDLHNSWQLSITWPLGWNNRFLSQLNIPCMSFWKLSCSFWIRLSCLGCWPEWQIGFPSCAKPNWLGGSARNSMLKNSEGGPSTDV